MKASEKNESFKSLVLVSADVSDMKTYLAQTGVKHKNYKSYTTYSKLAPKIEENAIYLSTGEHWNDIQDRESFNSAFSDTVNFGLCFSYAGYESVAMWMLYGGMENEGVMVDFTNAMIRQMLSAKSVDLVKWENGKFRYKTLSKEAYQIRLMDVVYVEHLNESADYYKIHRGTEKSDIKGEILDDLPPIRKAYPWNYEKECRLVLSVDRSELRDGYNSARIEIPGIYRDLSRNKRLYMSPNAKVEKIESTRDITFQPSKLNGTIDWDLCRDCKGKLNKRTKELAYV